MLNDVIAAISTPIGKGGIAVIRVSGRGCHENIAKIFFPKSQKKFTDYPPRFSVYGEICDKTSLIDTAIAVKFDAPASFTGEDMVEISCHGGYVVSSMILEAVLETGARMAQAGEFTRRAFVNNKVSLTEAEAIGDVLNAVNRDGVRLSSSQASGVLGEYMHGITSSLTSLISSIYAFIDYPDEDLEDVDDETLHCEIEALISSCRKLLSTYKAGNAIVHGIPTVIVGKPNVGKSSLFNSLIGEKKAIVTDIPGTTRDCIEYNADIKGVTVRLIDTAGLRFSTGDAVEKIGMDIAREKIFSSQTSMILALFDASRDLDENDFSILEALKNCEEKTVIPIITKSDLQIKIDKAFIEKQLGTVTVISNCTESGLDALKDRIFKSYIGDSLPSFDSAFLTGIRQKSVVQRGLDALLRADRELQNGFKDMTGMILEEALAILLEVDARSAGEAVVNEIFSKFCVGK